MIGKPGAIGGDKLTGTLTSREFIIKRRYITFRIGGGHQPGNLGVRLLVDGQQIELATGVDKTPMIMHSSDVNDYVGQSARLQIFDSATGAFGHISADDFRGTDQPAVRQTKPGELIVAKPRNMSPGEIAGTVVGVLGAVVGIISVLVTVFKRYQFVEVVQSHRPYKHDWGHPVDE